MSIIFALYASDNNTPDGRVFNGFFHPVDCLTLLYCTQGRGSVFALSAEWVNNVAIRILEENMLLEILEENLKAPQDKVLFLKKIDPELIYSR